MNLSNWDSAAFLLSWCFDNISLIFSIRIAFTSPDRSFPPEYSLYIFANFSSSCSKYFNHWQATSISTFPPFSRCSSTVSWPPENACLLILDFTVFGSSVKRIVLDESELLDFPVIPVSGDMNFAWRITGFLCPSF